MNPGNEVENNYRYVVLAARRARQLQSGCQPLVPARSTKACRVAQDEIAAGKVKLTPAGAPTEAPPAAGAGLSTAAEKLHAEPFDAAPDPARPVS
jgi:DNA-directed RNA polymerase subunit omega